MWRKIYGARTRSNPRVTPVVHLLRVPVIEHALKMFCFHLRFFQCSSCCFSLFFFFLLLCFSLIFFCFGYGFVSFCLFVFLFFFSFSYLNLLLFQRKATHLLRRFQNVFPLYLGKPVTTTTASGRFSHSLTFSDDPKGLNRVLRTPQVPCL